YTKQKNIPQEIVKQIYEEKKQKILKNVINIKDFKHYSVQIGSFTDLKNIIRVKEEIEQKLPYPITIVQKENDYQIRVGRFSERYPAEVLRQKLEEEGYKGFVVSPKLD
ncbi:MAG: SPOR domain-containing protein, partial [Leptonema sp. (in: bacteria)]